ncbi:BZ3500_MvSof-1268-A1-R1_Chr8-1g09915 [Microbotryum saponariae]|uniref:BZ3500_MvSof-1268-A1-R1_Chr8-1g09915 protein n=1 Tax=Microbotryum saponariae TaxID=289078 RepID=A0A2X0KSQ6_9BASI|nr:BZ3500_MvSof-1268-A1-R1_Chr8-1g09915 [Microbotryum saponariae]SDA08201.1 BZ3501_MvSof-1269-A2-R1_Chr8-1g09638 [Microbotryum saponariae]
MASVAITATIAPISDLPLALHHPLYLAAPVVEQRRSDAQYDAAVDLLADRILAHEAEYRRTGLVHTIASRSVLAPLISTRSRGGPSINPNSAAAPGHRVGADAALARRVLCQGIPLNEQESRDRLRIALEDKQTIDSARPSLIPAEKASGISRGEESPSTKIVLAKTASAVTLLDTFSASKVASSNSALSASKARRTSTSSRPKHSGGALGGPDRDGPDTADSPIKDSRPVRRLGSQPTRDIDAASPKRAATSESRSLGRDEQVLFEGGCTQMELPDPS